MSTYSFSLLDARSSGNSLASLNGQRDSYPFPSSTSTSIPSSSSFSTSSTVVKPSVPSFSFFSNLYDRSIPPRIPASNHTDTLAKNVQGSIRPASSSFSSLSASSSASSSSSSLATVASRTRPPHNNSSSNRTFITQRPYTTPSLGSSSISLLSTNTDLNFPMRDISLSRFRTQQYVQHPLAQQKTSTQSSTVTQRSSSVESLSKYPSSSSTYAQDDLQFLADGLQSLQVSDTLMDTASTSSSSSSLTQLHGPSVSRTTNSTKTNVIDLSMIGDTPVPSTASSASSMLKISTVTPHSLPLPSLERNSLASLSAFFQEQEARQKGLKIYKATSTSAPVPMVPTKFIHPLPIELSSEDTLLAKQCIYGKGSDTDILVKGFNVDFLRKDMRVLADRTWLKDEAINMWINLCNDWKQKDLSLPRSYIPNTFFLTTLMQDGRGYNYERVKKWTSRAKMDIFGSCDYVIFPRNITNTHWTVVFVDMRNKTIYHLDSMGAEGKDICSNILRWLKDEYKDKKGNGSNPPGELPNPEEWKLKGPPDTLPQQINGYDCGVYLCAMVYYLLQGKIPTTEDYDHDTITQLRSTLAVCIMKQRLFINDHGTK